VAAKCFSHFWEMVKMPILKSATGLVKVRGNKVCHAASSNKLIVIGNKNRKSPDATARGL